MEDKFTIVLMDNLYHTDDTTDLEIHIDRGRLAFFVSDASDYIQGYFRSVEDIELVIKELQNYVDGVKNGNS